MQPRARSVTLWVFEDLKNGPKYYAEKIKASYNYANERDWNNLSKILKKHEIETDSQSILIVEDDEITRDMLTKSLETNDFKVIVAKNGKEALQRVNKAKPALILLDLMMPEMDGFEFAEKLREKKEWLDIPVVVITAKDLTKEDHSRLKGNVEAIMQKGSYSKDELLSEVGNRIKKLKEKG